MKKVNLFFAGVFFLLLSVSVNAQTKTNMDYFVGKWHLTAESAPGGGSDMKVTLELKESKLDGTIKIGDEEPVIFSKIEAKESSVKLYFTSTHGYDISLNIEKKDDDHVTGALDTSVMGSFDVKGERIKENK